MKHGKPGPRLRNAEERLKNLAANLILHERIVTTVPKAKALKPWIDRIIDFAKSGTSEHIAKASNMMFKQELVMPKLVGPLLWRYRQMASPREWRSRYVTKPKETNTGVKHPGYSKIHLYGYRDVDSAPLAVIELSGNPRDTMARLGMRYLPAVYEQLKDVREKLYESSIVKIDGDESLEHLKVKTNLSSVEAKKLKQKEASLEKRIGVFIDAIEAYKLAAKAHADYEQWAVKETPDLQKKQFEEAKTKLQVYKRLVGGSFSGEEIRQMKLFGLEIDSKGNVLKEIPKSPFYQHPSQVPSFDYWKVDPSLEDIFKKFKLFTI